MLEKDEETKTKNDCNEIAFCLDQIQFIKNRSEDVTVQKEIAFNDADKHQLYKKATYRKVNKGDYVYRRRQFGDKLYFIIKGKAAVTFEDPELSRNQTTIFGSMSSKIYPMASLEPPRSRRGSLSARSIGSRHSRASRQSRHK